MALPTLADLATGDALPESWVDGVTGNVNFFSRPGADLASAATINITARYHKVTGTTQINNIIDASGATGGEPLDLWFTGQLTLKHLNGGAGQLRLAGGMDMIVPANTGVRFIYDPTNDVWQHVGLRPDMFIGCVAYHNADQALTLNTELALALNSEDLDTHGFHDLAVNNSRITIPAGLGGIYRIDGRVGVGDSNGWTPHVFIRRGGTQYLAYNNGAIAGVTALHGTFGCALVNYIGALAVGDYIELIMYQTSGARTADGRTTSDPMTGPLFTVQKIG